MNANRAPEVYAVAAVFLALTWITAFLRCYVRGVIVKKFGLEDYLAMLALILFTATVVFALQGISHSMGMHLADIPLQNLTPAMIYWFSTELAYVLAICALKMSVVVFLLRISVKRSHTTILYTTSAGVMIFTIGYFMFLIFQCSPIDYFWNHFSGKLGFCFDPELVGALTYAHSGLNAFADIVLAVLPVVIVSKLQMSPRTKVTLSIILSMGAIACVAVIVRIPYVKILVDNAKDFLYSSTDVVIWSTIEPGLAITAANLATLRPLCNSYLSRKKVWGTTTARGKYGHSTDLSGYSKRNGYIRNPGMEKEAEMNLSNLSNTRHQVTIEATHTTKSGSRGSQSKLQKSPSWDLERQSDQAKEEWPFSREIRKTIQTDIYSQPHAPLLQPLSRSHQRSPNSKTYVRRDEWPEVVPRSSHGTINSSKSLHDAVIYHWI